MRKAPTYSCNGGEVSISEVAAEFGLNPETVRQRLKKYGGNMQQVYDHYASERGGLSEEERAAEEIMNIIMLEPVEEEAAAETETEEPEEHTPNAEAETKKTAEAEALESLGRLNRAIDALGSVYEGDVGSLGNSLRGFIGELRAYRARKYERLVDWNAVAGGKNE